MTGPAAVRGGGLGTIAAATAVAGLMAYAITTVAARGLGPHDYADFSSFWGMQYLLVGALGGLQQEFSRAVTPAEISNPASRIVTRFAAVSAVAAGLVSLAVVLLFGPLVFGGEAAAFVAPLAVGIAANAAVSIFSGVMYGVSAWRVLAIVIVMDPLLRLASITVALVVGGGVTAAVWASVFPYGCVLVVLLLAMSRGKRTTFELDVVPRHLASNAVRTVGAAVGGAVLVSGLPLLVGLARGSATDAQLGTLVFVLILTRAPLVLAVLSLQSYLIVRLKSATGRLVLVLAGVVVGGGAVLTLAGYLWGAAVIVVIAGAEYAVSATLVAALVASSIATALLGVTGAFVLAKGHHSFYVAGWTAAAALSVALMFVLPGSLDFRVTVALSSGPLVGLAIHAFAFGRRPGRPRTSSGSDQTNIDA